VVGEEKIESESEKEKERERQEKMESLIFRALNILG